MDWLLAIAVLLGAAAGTALVVRSPSFWFGLGSEVLKALLPILLKRKSPEEEAKDHQKRREAQEDGPTKGHRGK